MISLHSDMTRHHGYIFYMIQLQGSKSYTCEMKLRLPTKHGSYIPFRDDMIVALMAMIDSDSCEFRLKCPTCCFSAFLVSLY